MVSLADLLQRESRLERELLLTRYRLELFPGTRHETAAVEAMATAQWRIERLRRHEFVLIEDQLNQLRAAHPDADSETLVQLAIDVLGKEGGAFDVIDGMEARYHSDYVAAADRLARLRGKK